MDIEEIRRIPVADFLQRLGHLPTRRQGNRLWYLAPYRKEKGASFNVNLNRNVWYDFGLGKGGDIFSLAGMMVNSCDFKEQAKFINGCFNAVPPEWEHLKYPIYNKVEQPAFEAVEYRTLASYGLLRYLKGRGIPKEVAAAHCEEVRYRNHGKPYFGIAFRNTGGGCEVRSRFFKGCIPPKDISLVANGSSVCHIYEGFMDYLSALTLGIGTGEDQLVLNSVSNLKKAFARLDGYSHIKCHLDNDDAGRRTLAALRKHFEGTEVQVFNCSGLYRGYKDLNEYLQTTTIKKNKMNLRMKIITVCSLIVAALGLASCDNGLDIQQSYPFTVETMPVPNKVKNGETVEIRCELKKEGEYADALYTVRYFQFEGEGTLKLDNGIAFLPNDRYLLEHDKFRLYYTSACDEAQNILVVVEDNFGNSYELEFDWNNDNRDTTDPNPEDAYGE